MSAVNGTKKPHAKDLSHFLSEEAKARKPSPLKEAFVHFMNPKVRSLGGGLPLPALFPFDAVTTKSLAPPFSQGIDQDILAAQDTVTIDVNKAPSQGIEDINLAVSLQYGQSQGDFRLRDFIKEHTKRIHDIGYADWDLILTCGNTFGWDAVIRTFTNRGDVILCDEFAFSSALETASAAGLKVIPVKMDLEGIDPEAFETQLANWTGPKPKLLYTIPTGQNPTGSSISSERRAAVYKIAQKYDFLIVEDEPYYYLQMPKYQPESERASGQEKLDRESFIKTLVPSYLHFDTDGRVVRLDSFSKVLAPGTRIGWIVCQENLIERFLRLLETSTQVPSGFSQSIVNGLLQRWGQDGYLDWLIALRKTYTEKRNLSCDAIYKYLPKGKFEIVPPIAGMFFWLKVDARRHPRYEELGRDAIKVENAMYDEGIEGGVQLVPGHWFMAGDSEALPEIEVSEEDKNAMFFRGTFASVPAEQLVEAIQRWAVIMEKLGDIQA